ncbi:hypothetical protein MMC14_008337 [Varicellaria rhodocarpa]|nr:hypothetical protein [Varicellaria rhodocarpa]
MQLLLRRKAQTLSIDDWIAVTTLIEHYNELRSDSQRAEIFQNLKLIAKATVEYSNSSEELDFVERLLSRVCLLPVFLYCHSNQASSKVLVNTLTLTTSTYTPLGLVLDPVVSMINHSCAPNAVISFSGSTLSLYSLISIRKDAQITISYVDNSVQPSMRQARLKSSYFFTCTCDECRVDTTLGRPDVPPELRPAAESGALRKADEHAAQKDAIACQYMNDDPGKGLKELQEGLRIIESMVPQTPYHRQPYAKLRVDYILACLATKDYLSAFVHSLVAYFYIDPIHFPQPFHPLRVVHNWTLFRLVLQVANLWQEGDVGLKGLVDRHQLNFGTILAGLSMEVEGNVARGHGPESKFGVLVRRKMAQLRTDLRGMGSGQGPQAQDVEEEWKKLRNIANGAQV